MIVAIDGTTASGKGTDAKMLATKLNISYLDTGSIYRALTVFFLSGGKDLEKANVRLENNKIFLDNKDITGRIRDNEVSCNVAIYAKRLDVQDKVHKVQREFAKNNSLVVEGRETTSVAFPNADYKFYIDCDINIRAERRFKDLKNVPLEEVKKQIEERDRLDKTREHSPLVKVADAIEIDASKTPEEIVAKMLSFIL